MFRSELIVKGAGLSIKYRRMVTVARFIIRSTDRPVVASEMSDDTMVVKKASYC